MYQHKYLPNAGHLLPYVTVCFHSWSQQVSTTQKLLSVVWAGAGPCFLISSCGAEFTTKRVAEEKSSSLAVLEEHFSVPNLHINLTYPPFYIAKHCIWPLLVKKFQDAVFYSLHFLSLFMSLWLSAFTSIVIQLIKMVNVCNQVSKYFYPDSILKLL